jgi:hypothetical protein
MKKTYIIISFVCLIIVACSEQRTEYFINGTEAQRSTTAKHGWIPEWFPTAAKEIQMQYDIDTNYRWFRFKLDKEARNSFIRIFQPVSWDEAKNIKARAPRSAKWWFEGLIQAQPANDSALNADIYIRNDIRTPEKAYLAVSKTDDSIFLWIER